MVIAYAMRMRPIMIVIGHCYAECAIFGEWAEGGGYHPRLPGWGDSDMPSPNFYKFFKSDLMLTSAMIKDAMNKLRASSIYPRTCNKCGEGFYVHDGKDWDSSNKAVSCDCGGELIWQSKN